MNSPLASLSALLFSAGLCCFLIPNQTIQLISALASCSGEDWGWRVKGLQKRKTQSNRECFLETLISAGPEHHRGLGKVEIEWEIDGESGWSENEGWGGVCLFSFLGCLCLTQALSCWYLNCHGSSESGERGETIIIKVQRPFEGKYLACRNPRLPRLASEALLTWRAGCHQFSWLPPASYQALCPWWICPDSGWKTGQ